jgi:ATP-dependent DNA ligase
MDTVEIFPILYGTEKNGKVKMWKAHVLHDKLKNIAQAVIEFGQIDGKHQIITRDYDKGKNIGKKNETTSVQQCILETRRKWLDKKEKESYSEEKSEEKGVENVEEKKDEKKEEKIFPMLAHVYEPVTSKKKKNDISYPCYVQPKLDGLRCVVYQNLNGEIRFQSRTGAYFDGMMHLIPSLVGFFKKNPSLVLDGELYTDRDVMPFEELAGLIKKKKLTETDYERLTNVIYHVYDIVDETIPFSERYDRLEKLFDEHVNFVNLVDTYEIETKDQFRAFFSRFVQDGYEGIMLRNKDGMYRCNYRSHDLQKYKEFIESEYEITGFKEGDGRDKGTVIWLCKNSDGNEFSVRPRGTVEFRRECFTNGSSYIGKKLTVIYQELSEMGIPRFPVGKAIREDY